ncbi:hypothetical protein [Daejeonella lutea]|uniref:Uncharacterized protein n=1 Tax=Daejeonella lutea TaxID=572036 RepID=A0A1T5AEM3_9SPHI|nr:hypothetical protein [Daejeonella lutea]SKB33408.1 hypothetical protein SAMN05661099_0641 [Daejeonella lutea]
MQISFKTFKLFFITFSWLYVVICVVLFYESLHTGDDKDPIIGMVALIMGVLFGIIGFKKSSAAKDLFNLYMFKKYMFIEFFLLLFTSGLYSAIINRSEFGNFAATPIIFYMCWMIFVVNVILVAKYVE